MKFPNIKPRTIAVFSVLLIFVYFLVKTVTLYWISIFFNVLLIYINSVFLFAYFEIKDKKEPIPKEWPSVSIIIPNYNNKNLLFKCIEHVKAMAYKGTKEIIVVDDGSSDGSKELLGKISGIKLILKKKNEGKAAALNDGIASAKGKVIVTIDSDTYPNSDCLEKMVPKLKNEVKAVTGFVRAYNVKGIVARIQEVEYLVSFGFFQSILSDLNAILVTPGPMSVYDAKTLREIGGFDVNNITEDMEIAFRLREHGAKMIASIDAHIYTEVPHKIKALFRQRVRWYRGKFFNTVKYSKMLFNKKYGDFGLFTFPFSVIVEWCIVLFIFIFVAANVESFLQYFGLVSSFLAVGNNLSVLTPSVIALNSNFLFYLIGAVFYTIFIYFSHLLAGDKLGIHKLPEITLFIIIYGLFILVVFFFGFFKEINSSEYVW